MSYICIRTSRRTSGGRSGSTDLPEVNGGPDFVYPSFTGCFFSFVLAPTVRERKVLRRTFVRHEGETQLREENLFVGHKEKRRVSWGRTAGQGIELELELSTCPRSVCYPYSPVNERWTVLPWKIARGGAQPDNKMRDGPGGTESQRENSCFHGILASDARNKVLMARKYTVAGAPVPPLRGCNEQANPPVQPGERKAKRQRIGWRREQNEKFETSVQVDPWTDMHTHRQRGARTSGGWRAPSTAHPQLFGKKIWELDEISNLSGWSPVRFADEKTNSYGRNSGERADRLLRGVWRW